MLEAVYINTVVFLGGLIQGLTGFGFALIAVPLLIAKVSPDMVVAMVVMLPTLICIVILKDNWRLVQFRSIYPIALMSLIATPLGVMMLKSLNRETLKLIVGVTILVFAVLLFRGLKLKINNERLAGIPVGFLSGFLNGSIGMCGPPIILLFTNQDLEKSIFRANVSALFLFLNMVTIATFYLNQMLSMETVTFCLKVLPGIVIGSLTGIFFSKRVHQQLFRKIGLTIVALAGVVSIVSGLGLYRF